MSTQFTDFGYQTIPITEKTEKVHNVFSSVANHYDIMNDVMSMGWHRLWKAQFVNALPLKPHLKWLDIASGTGDIIESIYHKTKGQGVYMASDINLAMLQAGAQRLYNKAILEIPWHFGVMNAECLPIPDHSFDVYTVVFGLRNMTHKETVLREAYRVLKPGGYFYCMEFSFVKMGLLRKLYDMYSFHLIPKMGEYITKDKAAYEYFVESIRRFPKQEVLAQNIQEAGFDNVDWRNLTLGMVSIHKGFKA